MRHLRAVPNGSQPAWQDGLDRGPAWMTDDRRHCSPAFGANPEWFFAVDTKTQYKAKALCKGCPFRDKCRQWADEKRVPFGIWGGINRASERRPARDTEAEVRALWEQGLSNALIARRMGVWHTTVGDCLRRMGLTPNYTNRRSVKGAA